VILGEDQQPQTFHNFQQPKSCEESVKFTLIKEKPGSLQITLIHFSVKFLLKASRKIMDFQEGFVKSHDRLDLGCGRGSMIERWLGHHPPSFLCIDKLPGNSAMALIASLILFFYP